MKRAIKVSKLFNGYEYQDDMVILFDKTIESIIPADIFKEDIEIEEYSDEYILYPGFINTHTHLEFSTNRATLKYGSFVEWLYSVIEHRGDLMNEADDEAMLNSTQEMLNSGITTFGAISSMGLDLEVCKKTPQKVVYFNEVIGSIPSAVDALFADFKERVSNSRASSPEDKITPAIAIHSPYSVHPILAKRAIEIAKDLNMPLSTHFLESKAERDWLERSNGEMAPFFKEFFNTDRAINSIEGFLELFKGTHTLFVHCTQANDEELRYLNEHGHYIAHCPRSNRLLGNGRLAIEKITAPLSVATDGYSSNWSLNIFDELRAALMMHTEADLNKLSLRLIRSITSDAAKSLKSSAGVLDIDRVADMVLIKLPTPTDRDSLALHTILHIDRVEKVWIDGEEVIK